MYLKMTSRPADDPLSSSEFSLLYLRPSRSERFREAMSGCLDGLSCSCECALKDRFLEWWRSGGRNLLASVIAGVLVSRVLCVSERVVL